MAPFRDTVLQIERNGIGAVSSLAFGNPDVIPLWFGEGDLPTPTFIRDAAKAALDEGRTFYVQSRGIPQLREAVRGFFARHNAVNLDVERISIPGSAMMAVNVALQLTLSAGDNALILGPIWPNIYNAVRVIGAEARVFRLTPPAGTARWTLDMDGFLDQCDARTRAIFVCSPGNPTGWVMSAEEQLILLKFARERNIAIISDEVYGPLTYGEPAPSFVQIAQDHDPVFVIHSLSKAWAMTGWRVGFLVHPTQLGLWIGELTNIDNTGATSFAQFGAAVALNDGDAFNAQLRAICAKGRDIVAHFVEAQPRVRWAKPDGAFYGFLEIEGVHDSLHFASDLALRHGVGVAPGSAFGLNDPRNEGFIRICFAQDAGRLSVALDRLGHALKDLPIRA